MDASPTALATPAKQSNPVTPAHGDAIPKRGRSERAARLASKRPPTATKDPAREELRRKARDAYGNVRSCVWQAIAEINECMGFLSNMIENLATPTYREVENILPNVDLWQIRNALQHARADLLRSIATPAQRQAELKAAAKTVAEIHEQDSLFGEGFRMAHERGVLDAAWAADFGHSLWEPGSHLFASMKLEKIHPTWTDIEKIGLQDGSAAKQRDPFTITPDRRDPFAPSKG